VKASRIRHFDDLPANQFETTVRGKDARVGNSLEFLNAKKLPGDDFGVV
jgi:hypothetical protein